MPVNARTSWVAEDSNMCQSTARRPQRAWTPRDPRPDGGLRRYIMTMRRARRRIAAWIGLLGLLLAQLTTLAHACPLIEAALAPAPAPVVMEMAVPCEGMGGTPATDTVPPCVDHCQYGSHAANTISFDQPTQAPVAFLVIEAVPTHSPSTPDVTSLLARSTAPPVFASSSRLRI